MIRRRRPAPRPHGRTAAAAGTTLAVLLLTGCSRADAPAVPATLPSNPVCEPRETPDSCLDDVRLALQSAFVDAAERGTVTHADFERIVGSVVSFDRLGGDFSYTLLTEPRDGVLDTDAVGPRQFRVGVPGASGTWWACPQQGRVQVAACQPQD